MTETDLSAELTGRVRDAAASATPLRIVGGDSKAFYGRPPRGEPLHVGGHRGIVEYEPTELVITARAGTPLDALAATLDAQRQMLPFEPPRYGPRASLGGTIACNLSGPRRPYAGAARDFVLGTRVINGRGESLAFGGQVMKNVAGYDVSRLMCGALGTLGVLLEVSLKVLPRPQTEITLSLEMDTATALEQMHDWARRPLPISASCLDAEGLHVRLSGTSGAVASAHEVIGGEPRADGAALWRALREHEHPFFAGPEALWRLSVASDTPPLALAGRWLHEWGGALRWLRSAAGAEAVHAAAREAGGHATLFRGGARDMGVFQPLPEGLLAIHRRLKQAFDPQGILNPGRMYPQF